MNIVAKPDKSKMEIIKLTDKFSAKRDNYQWILTEKIDSPNSKKGYTERESYHPSMKRCLTTVMERESGKCKSVLELMEYIKSFENKLNELFPKERDI